MHVGVRETETVHLVGPQELKVLWEFSFCLYYRRKIYTVTSVTRHTLLLQGFPSLLIPVICAV